MKRKLKRWLLARSIKRWAQHMDHLQRARLEIELSLIVMHAEQLERQWEHDHV